jgi:hypothetical protein
MSVAYSGCVFVALGTQHATRMRHFLIYDIPGCTNFSTLCHKWQDFRGKSYWIWDVCLEFLYTVVLRETLLIMTGTERVIIKLYICLHVEYAFFLSDLNETWIFWTDFRKILKYQISWKSIHWEQNCSTWTDEANSLLSQFCECP